MKSCSDKRKLFCFYYVKYGNIYEAGLRAGFPPESALADGIDCLRSDYCRKLIEKLYSVVACTPNGIMAGLERLAFGNANDIIALAFSDELPDISYISKLDLFNVSEIKKVKGGGVEIKLFDRLKALEKMFEFANTCNSSDTAQSLINALAESVGDDDCD